MRCPDGVLAGEAGSYTSLCKMLNINKLNLKQFSGDPRFIYLSPVSGSFLFICNIIKSFTILLKKEFMLYNLDKSEKKELLSLEKELLYSNGTPKYDVCNNNLNKVNRLRFLWTKKKELMIASLN
jgi:hypothetical protein